jgi:ATP-dependent DNA helicase RecG
MTIDSQNVSSFKEEIVNYIKQNGSINNTTCRSLLNIDYDQAIYLFKELLKEKSVERIGRGPSTRYVLPSQSHK